MSHVGSTAGTCGGVGVRPLMEVVKLLRQSYRGTSLMARERPVYEALQGISLMR